LSYGCQSLVFQAIIDFSRVSAIIPLTPVLTPDTPGGVNMTHRIRSKAGDKPPKPYPDFPLFPHATGRWAKKIRGKLHYFGTWADPQAALNKYLDQRDDLHAGRTPRVSGEGVTLRDVLNRFLTAKKHLADAGEITARTFGEYHATCELLADAFGRTRLVLDLASDDFERLRATLAKRLGPVALGNEVQRIRGVFKYAYEAGLIDRPVRYGPGFKRPNRRMMRKVKAARGPRMFEAGEIRALLAAAGAPMRAMILLGINCGFGNADCGTLPLKALDLDRGWVNFPRPKTGIARRCPLWPETVEALKAALASRPEPKDEADAGRAFVTKYGGRWAKGTPDSPVAKEFAKVMREAGVEKPGVGFYGLRHTFETIGGEAKDQVAVDHIMGHARDDMASVYRERISDERLRAVTDHVRDWLIQPPLLFIL
jgi:integrase